MANSKNSVKILKILFLVFIPLILLEFVFYSNFLASQEFYYNYDIGGETSYLSPTNRISEPFTDENNNLTYISLIDGLVYFNSEIPKGSETINISVKFKDNFPQNTKFSLGAKNDIEWSYQYNILYNKVIEDLIKKYPYKKQDNLLLIKTNKYAKDYSINELLNNPSQTRLATDLQLPDKDFIIPDYTPKDFEISTALRGSLEFYVYIKGDFNIEVEKRDLNWYENDEKGEDIVNISLYDLDNNLIAQEIIKDDGEDEKESDKNNTDTQKAELFVSNLKQGVYKLKLNNNQDLLITNIKLNQNKIILNKQFFPAGSEAYFNDFQESSKIYFKTFKPIELNAKTYHNAGEQILRINSQELDIVRDGETYTLDIDESENFYQVVSKKNDYILTGPDFFSFSKESWFNPFTGIVSYRNDLSYLEQNADYVLVEYVPAQDLENNWKLAKTSFNLQDDELVLKDNRELSFVFNIPHLAQNKPETNIFHIPVDYINITIHKPAIK